MPLTGVYVFPHGALTLNPGQFPFYSGVSELNKSCFQLANEIQSKNPDTIFLITPHGISLESSFGVYLNTNARGSAEWKGSFSDFTVEANIDTEISYNLLAHLQKNGNKAEGIVAYSEEEPLPLRWGEAIPLWFISQAYRNNSLVQKPFPKLVVIALPRKRNLMGSNCGSSNNNTYNDFTNNSNSSSNKGFVRQLFYGNSNSDGIDFLKECHKFGRHLGEFCNENKRKFVLLISGDLAHKHVYPPQLKNDSISNNNLPDSYTDNLNFESNKNLDENKLGCGFPKGVNYYDLNINSMSNKKVNSNDNINYNSNQNYNFNKININNNLIQTNVTDAKININNNKEINNLRSVLTQNNNNNDSNQEEAEGGNQKVEKNEIANSKLSTRKNLERLKLLGEDDADLLDLSIKEWILNPIINEQILINALDYQKKFLSCGYFGFVVLLGFIKEFSDLFEEIKGEVLACYHPTYYGMMVAKLNLKEFSDYVLIKK